LRTIATELVDMSKKATSGRMPSINPLAPSATCSTSAGTGSEVKTISLCAPSAFVTRSRDLNGRSSAEIGSAVHSPRNRSCANSLVRLA
jgi:hypothetical protein